MANIARGEAKCYISIEVECFVFHIARGRAMILSVIKNFLAITKHTNCANYVNTSHQIRINSLCCNVYYLIHRCAG